VNGVVSSALATPVTPEGMLRPNVRAIWLPLLTGTSTVTGGTSPNGFTNYGNLGSTTKDVEAVITVSSGTPLSWRPEGGLVFGTGNAYLEAVPGTSETEAWTSAMLDLQTFTEEQTLVVGCVLTTPVGYAAANSSTVCMLSVGDLQAGAHGFAFQHSSIEVPSMNVWPKGASDSFAPTMPTGWGSVQDATTTALVWELKSDGDGLFKLRGHRATSTGVVSTTWTAQQDFKLGGTEAPGVPSATGIRIGGRRSGSSNNVRMQSAQTIQGVCLIRFNTLPPDNMASSIALDLVRFPGRFPSTARRYETDDAEFEDEPDGNADETFGVITLGDMHVALNGKRAIADHPSFSTLIEPMLGRRSPSFEDQPQWVSTSEYEGIARIADPPGGLKIGRTTLAPASAAYPAFVTSAYANPGSGSYPADQTNRNRSEIFWNGPLVWLPRQQPMWIAGRYYYDFDMGSSSGQHATIFQLFHHANGAGLNPCFDVSLFPDRWSVSIRYSVVEGMTKTDQVLTNYDLVGKYEEMRAAWFDLVIYCKVSWDRSHGGFARLYLNDNLVLDHSGPIGYKGPTATGKTPVEQIRTGNYPGVATAWTPDSVRDVYIRRFFVCRDVGNYTLSQIRQALVV